LLKIINKLAAKESEIELTGLKDMVKFLRKECEKVKRVFT